MSDPWRISAEDAEEYTRALGQVMSGGWRQIALAQRLGVPAALDMTTEAWVRERIGGYVRLGLDERRDAVKELTNPEGEYHLTQRQAAEVLGVDHSTVSRDRRGGVDAPPDKPYEGGDDAIDGADAPGERAFSGEPFCDDCGEPHDGDEPCPEIAVYPPGLGGPPTVGDVLQEIAERLDESGAFEAVDQEARERSMRATRLGWLRLVTEYPPGVLLDGVKAIDIPELIEDLDRFIDWLQAARAIAVGMRRPRRVEA